MDDYLILCISEEEAREREKKGEGRIVYKTEWAKDENGIARPVDRHAVYEENGMIRPIMDGFSKVRRDIVWWL